MKNACKKEVKEVIKIRSPRATVWIELPRHQEAGVLNE